MPSLLTSNRWMRKPPLGSTLDTSHPLCPTESFLFNEAGGLRTSPLSGRRARGVIGAGVTWKAGTFGPGLDFDGVDYVDFGDNPDYQATTFTVLARIRGSSAAYGTVWGWGATAPQLRKNPSGNLELLKSNVALIGTSNTAMATGTLYQVGVSYDGTNYKFYLNGKPDGSGSNAQTFGFGVMTLKIGIATAEPMVGHIEHVHYWNRVLSDGEVAAVYEQPYGFVKPSANKRLVWVPDVVAAARPNQMALLGVA